MSNLLYKIGAAGFRVYFRLFRDCEIIGEENIPAQGRLIVMANHISYFDPPLLGSIMDRQVHFMAKEELFKYPVLGYLLKQIGQFPVKRGRPDRSAIKKAYQILRQEKVLGIFPEGTTRKNHGKLKKAQSGAVLIPIKTESPILPVGIKSSGKKLQVSFGKPYTLEEYYRRKMSREDRIVAGKYIMDKIKEQINKL